MKNEISKRRAVIYLIAELGSLFLIWLTIVLLPKDYKEQGFLFLWAVFSLLPIISTFIARLLTGDKSSWYIKPNIKKSWRVYLFGLFVPSAMIFLGGLFFYLIFPGELDVTARTLYNTYSMYGAPEDLLMTPLSIFITGVVFIFVSPLVIPFHIFALGEEIGWRGYLLPNFLKYMSVKKAVLLNGLYWGIAHAPLIYFGFNYGTGYWGEPYTGIILMVICLIFLGIWISYVTIKSSSIIPAVLLHGSINVISILPGMVSKSNVSVLLGPDVVGIIGMTPLALGGIIILYFLIKKYGKDTFGQM